MYASVYSWFFFQLRQRTMETEIGLWTIRLDCSVSIVQYAENKITETANGKKIYGE